MATKAKLNRTMDIHLLSQVPDDGSPFGVEYSTRRLILERSGEVSCDQPKDPLWRELAAGIAGRELKKGVSVQPGDGARFMDCILDYLRYHFLSPLMPVMYDWCGPARPHDFRIVWNSKAHLGVGHGYGFGYRTTSTHTGTVPLIATINGWGFMHEFDSPEERIAEDRIGKPRLVIVDLLRRDAPEWGETGLDADHVLAEIKPFLRAFLRRFFERRTIGLMPEDEGQLGRFVWRGGF